MKDETTIDPQTSQYLEAAPLGEVLLAARNTKKLTQKDVSDNLRLSIKQIDALEKNEFSALPEAMIARGFIRNYARLLDVDAEPLLAVYRNRVPDKSPGAISVQSSMYKVMSSKDSQPWLKYILGSILVLLFLLAWFFYMDYMPKPAKQITEKKVPNSLAATTESAALPLPEIALPAAERQADSSDNLVGSETAVPTSNSTNPAVTNADVSNATPKNTIPNGNVSNPLTQNQSIGENTSVAPSPIQTPQAPAIDLKGLKDNAGHSTEAVSQKNSQSQVSQDVKSVNKSEPAFKVDVKDSAVGTKKVNMSFSEQTWVRVTNNSGKVIFEKTLAAGSVDGFDGEPPFNFVIGNAKATKLFFLGKQIDLATSTKSNVARITLE